MQPHYTINKKGVNKMVGIYSIVCLKNSKIYIGQSKDIKLRWLSHKEELQKGTHQNRHLQRAWNKYGENSFIFSIIEECNEESLTEREQYWIDYYGGINSTNTYNFRQAGSNGKMSEETLKKMSEATKRLRQNPEWVKKNAQAIRDSWTPERRKQMSIQKTGIKWTESQRKNRKKFDDMRRGVTRSEEVKAKVSATLMGHTVSEATRQKLREAGKKQIHKPLTVEQRKNVSDGAKRGWDTRRKNGNVSMKGVNKGFRWMIKDGVAVRVRPGEIEQYVNQGYKFGRKEV